MFCRFFVVPHYWCCCKDARCFNHFIALQCVQIILFTSLCGVTYTTFLSFIAAHRSGFSPTSNEIFAPCLCRLFLGGFPHTRHYHQQQQQRSRSGSCMFCLLCMFGCSLPAFGGCLVHFWGIVAYSATIFHVNWVMQKNGIHHSLPNVANALKNLPAMCVLCCVASWKICPCLFVKCDPEIHGAWTKEMPAIIFAWGVSAFFFWSSQQCVQRELYAIHLNSDELKFCVTTTLFCVCLPLIRAPRMTLLCKRWQ